MNNLNLESFLLKKELEKNNIKFDLNSLVDLLNNKNLKEEIKSNLKFSKNSNKFEKHLFNNIFILTINKIENLIENNKNPDEELNKTFYHLNIIKEYFKEEFNLSLKDLDFSEEQIDLIDSTTNINKKAWDFINQKFFKSIEINQEDKLKSKLQEFFFNEDIYSYIFNNDKLKRKDIENYEKFFNYLVDSYCPSKKAEELTKFYAYCASGNFYKDFNNNKDIQHAYQNKNNEKLCELVSERIRELYIPLIVKKDPNDKKDYSSYIVEADKKSEIFNLRSSPSGYIDYAIQSTYKINGKNNLMVFRVSSNFQENDLYNHDEKRIEEDNALKNYSILNDFNLEITEVFKSHKEKNLKKIDISSEDNIKDIKNLFDTIVNISVGKFTDLYTDLILLGDREYKKEYLKNIDYYKSTNKIIELYINNKEFDNKLSNLMIRTLKWLDMNLKYEINENNIEYIQKNIKENLIKLESITYDQEKISDLANNCLEKIDKNDNKSIYLAILNTKIKELTKRKKCLENTEIQNPFNILGSKDKAKLKDSLFELHCTLDDVLDKYENLYKKHIRKNSSFVYNLCKDKNKLLKDINKKDSLDVALYNYTESLNYSTQWNNDIKFKFNSENFINNIITAYDKLIEEFTKENLINKFKNPNEEESIDDILDIEWILKDSSNTKSSIEELKNEKDKISKAFKDYKNKNNKELDKINNELNFVLNEKEKLRRKDSISTEELIDLSKNIKNYNRNKIKGRVLKI